MKKKLIILGCGSSVGVPRIDGFWGKDLHIWDVEAGICLVNEAKGKVFQNKLSKFKLSAKIETTEINGNLQPCNICANLL